MPINASGIQFVVWKQGVILGGKLYTEFVIDQVFEYPSKEWLTPKGKFTAEFQKRVQDLLDQLLASRPAGSGKMYCTVEPVFPKGRRG